MSAPNVGEVLAGKYRVERVLGQGGMGVVVQATHLQLDELVAVKFLLSEYVEHPEAAARFLREARAAVKIKSEHVARVIDVGTLESGAPYMVMEFLRGRDLSEVLAEAGQLPVETAVECILQACEAIAEAHAAGIVHRDLKPANLFLSSRADGSPTVKVLDFGISKVTRTGESGGDMSLTKTTAMMGSPLYMCPEQMRSARDVDARADIWALGVILYELLTGRTPFLGDSLPQLCTAILSDTPPSPRMLRTDVPPELDQAIMACLAKNPADRHPSVAELAIALSPFAPRQGRVSAERVSRVLSAAGLSKSVPSLAATEIPRTQPGPPGTIAPWGQTAARTAPHPPKQSRTLLFATLGGLLTAGAGIAVALSVSAGDVPAASSASAAAPPAPTAPLAEGVATAEQPMERTQPDPKPIASASSAASADEPEIEPAATVEPAASALEPPVAKSPPRVTARPKTPPKVEKAPEPATAKPPDPQPPKRGVDLFGDRK